jgi:hypothetical protein
MHPNCSTRQRDAQRILAQRLKLATWKKYATHLALWPALAV